MIKRISVILSLCIMICINTGAYSQDYTPDYTFEQGIKGIGAIYSSNKYKLPKIYSSDKIAKEGSKSLEVIMGSSVGEGETDRSMSSFGYGYQGLTFFEGKNLEDQESIAASGYIYTESRSAVAKFILMNGAKATEQTQEFRLNPGQWNYVYGLFENSEKIKRGSIRLVFYGVNKNDRFYVDDLKCSADYLSTGGFEKGTFKWEADSGVSISCDVSKYFSGSKSAKLNIQESKPIEYVGIRHKINKSKFTLGKKYLMSCYIYTEHEEIYSKISFENVVGYSDENELKPGVWNYVSLVIDPSLCSEEDLIAFIGVQGNSGSSTKVFIDDVKIRGNDEFADITSVEDKKLIVKGSLRSGNENREISIAVKNNDDNSIVKQTTAVTDGQSRYEAEIELDNIDAVSSELTVEISGIRFYEDMDGKVTGKYVYFDPIKCESIRLRIAESKSPDELNAILSDKANSQAMGYIKISIFRNIIDKNFVYNYIISAPNSEKASIDKLHDLVIEACAIDSVKNSKSTLISVIETYSRYLKLQSNKIYNDLYGSMKNDNKLIFSACFYENPFQIQNNADFQKSVMHSIIKTYVRGMSLYTDVIGMLRKYQLDLGIDFTILDSASLSLTNKTKATVEFAEYAVAEKDYRNLNENLRKIVNSYSQSNPPKGGGPSSSGDRQRTATIAVEQTQTGVEYNFVDLDGFEWAKESIYGLLNKNVISQSNDKMFRPDDNITRAEAAKLISLAFGIYYDKAECGFSDVTLEDWFYIYVASLNTAGIINGYTDSKFHAEKSISREEFCTMLYRTLNVKSIKINTDKNVEFSDAEDISEYAVEAVKKLSESGAVNGYENGLFLPKENINRAESAKLIYSLVVN